MSTTVLLIILFASILLIVIGTSVLKLHPFLSLLIVTVIVGFMMGLPAVELLSIIGSGFGQILAYIGIVIVLGSILGELLEQSGATEVIAKAILHSIGRKNPQLALMSLGSLVGVPVFCDTGFIILSRLGHSIAKNKVISSKRLSVGLAAGLYTTHTLVPPTPGPIAASGIIGISDYLGLVILVGVSFAIINVFFTNVMVERLKFKEEITSPEIPETSSDIRLSFGSAIFPVVLPIVLIALGTGLKLLEVSGGFSDVIQFLGNPVISLLLSVLLAYPLLRIRGKNQFAIALEKAVKSAGPVLIITGAGGAFGAVLKSSPLAENLENTLIGLQDNHYLLFFLAFLLAAILKTAQGSSTSAIVITSSMLAAVLPTIGLTEPFDLTLVVMAIGAGAMTVSHANDSYFWVVSQFGGLSLKEAYKSFTLVTLFQGIVTLLLVLLTKFLIG